MVLVPGDEPMTADGVMIHEQLIPAWLIPAIALLAVIAAALVALWFLVLRPQVQSIATQQVQQQVSQAASAASQASQAASQASHAAAAAQGSAGGSGSGSASSSTNGAGGAGSTSGANGGGSSGSGNTDDTAFRISTGANPVTNGSFQNFTFTEPNHKSLDIGDLVLQNPRGDSGILRIELGSNVILEEGLDNFRDLDYHYEVPLHVDADAQITIAVDCVTPGTGASQCTPSVSFSGKIGS
jgi:hypothetical protein